MKKFTLKDNWFKIIIAIAILIIVVFVGYYFIIYLPKEKKEYLTNQIRCRQEGNKLYLSEKEEGEKYASSMSNFERILGYFIYNPEFKFNKKLNTCLYKGEKRWGEEINFKSYFIKDVYTNKNIFIWESVMDKSGEWKDNTSNEIEWSKKYNEIFGN